jgi:hypothetical protein
MADFIEKDFNTFVTIGVAIFVVFGIIVLLAFRSIFRKLDRGQVVMDEKLRQYGVGQDV